MLELTCSCQGQLSARYWYTENCRNASMPDASSQKSLVTVSVVGCSCACRWGWFPSLFPPPHQAHTCFPCALSAQSCFQVISVNPVPSDVYLTFAAAIPGRYWAFILPSDRPESEDPRSDLLVSTRPRQSWQGRMSSRWKLRSSWI